MDLIYIVSIWLLPVLIVARFLGDDTASRGYVDRRTSSDSWRDIQGCWCTNAFGGRIHLLTSEYTVSRKRQTCSWQLAFVPIEPEPAVLTSRGVTPKRRLKDRLK